MFLFLFIPCLFSCIFFPVLHLYTENDSFSFFGLTPSLRIPILCMFMPNFKECKSLTSIPSSWYLNLHLLMYILSAFICGFESFSVFFYVSTLFFMLSVFITLGSENGVARITLPIEYLDKLVNRKL